MAYRRSITARFNLFSQHRLSPSISLSHRHHNVSENSETSPISRNPPVRNYIQHRFLGAGNNFSSYWRFSVPAGYGIACHRNYSNETVKIEVLNEVVSVSGDKAPVHLFSPELVASIDWFPPVVAFQHLIDYVHCFTGFNWWASIAATTIIIRFLMIPLDIHRRKTEVKYSLDAFEKEYKVDEYQGKWNTLLKEYGIVSPLQPLISVLVHGSMFFAVICMAAKNPTFKDGGVLWFTDLTDPISLLQMITTSAIYCSKMHIQGKLGMNEDMKIRFCPDIVFLVLACQQYPQATYFVWTTSVLFSVVYELAIKDPQVKKLLGIPIVPKLPSTNQKSKEE